MHDSLTRATGFCLGASTVSCVDVERNGSVVRIVRADARSHSGNARLLFETLLAEHYPDAAALTAARLAVTGRKFRDRVRLSSLPEPEAVERAYRHVKDETGPVDCIVSAGGETFMAYELDARGMIVNVLTGNKCASGTGEFFLQQIKRMNLSVEEALAQAEPDHPHPLAGRCSVFCKSDCTHALNKGEVKGRVVAGLCRMMALKILELLIPCKGRRVLLTGGTSRNALMVRYVRKALAARGIEVTVPTIATGFEALGAALWALDHPTRPPVAIAQLFDDGTSSFAVLPALGDQADRVAFKTMERGRARAGDRCIIGLDVGSTTTKAVVMRTGDHALLASVYLRTNGDPVRASRECYANLAGQMDQPIRLVGLGVTGSGRQIAGLHGLTDGVINEIVAHATAAVHFDPEVDTIFEIGGQDAKYTHLTQGVASDYAMNEACSAGTGSFLEESAHESMGIATEAIGDLALLGRAPPNFNDQCAAFIGSDIKTAIQEGIGPEDIVAGLVYSICLNYVNRVKGNRAVGHKVFMQGGVCYNRAVPIAMAALIGRPIVVPPEPGLMGAYGVALAIEHKLGLGLLAEGDYDLAALARREVTYGKSFVCHGGKEHCDRRCRISSIEIEGEKYPFGGACNRFVNLRRNLEVDVGALDLVTRRERLVFAASTPARADRPTVGIHRSLLVQSLYPLYRTFFQALDFEVVDGVEIDAEAIGRKGAAFCYPVELAHGLLGALLRKNPDWFFLPQVCGLPVSGGIEASVTCPLVQGEPYYLQSAFKELRGRNVLSPILDFSKGFEQAEEAFITIGRTLGCSRAAGRRAFRLAVAAQRACLAEMQELGRRALLELEADPSRIGIVLFGRPYSAFASNANMGIPHKFASRGQLILPLDFLPYGDEAPEPKMYWSTGQMILKAARLVARHPQLFPVYISNFSCGPDSFLLGFFRRTLGRKPSLTLELDSHTADAAVETRIEAFLDVVASHIELRKRAGPAVPAEAPFRPAAITAGGRSLRVVDSQGRKHALTDPRVHLLIPSMGDTLSRGLAAVFRSAGIRATAVPPPDEAELKLGRMNVSCKECLPLVLTLGSLLGYLEKRTSRDELLVYFMPESSGPCRFGQYNVLIANLLEKNRVEDVALLSLTDDNGYAGLGTRLQLRLWQSVVISDALDDIHSALRVLARDPEAAFRTYEAGVHRIEQALERENWDGIQRALREVATALAAVPRKGDIHEVTQVGLIGETYVRRDPFSLRNLVAKLAEQDIVVKKAPIAEWIYYCDFLFKKGLYLKQPNARERLGLLVEGYFKNSVERTVKRIFARSGFYEYRLIDVARLIENVSHLVPARLVGGDAVLTVGAALAEIIDEVSGVIAIGPFGCLPSRIAEAILTHTLNDEKGNVTDDVRMAGKVMAEHPSLPFLAIESDGNVFPQVIQARLEAFCLQVARVHRTIREAKGKG